MRKWTGLDIGWEFDFTRFAADSKAPEELATNLNSFIVSGNLMVRKPVWITPEFPHGHWSAYGGIGWGADFLTVTTPQEERDSDLSGVISIPVGVEVMLTPRLSFFGEYKWTGSHHTLSLNHPRERATLRASHVYGGLALHFAPPRALQPTAAIRR